MAAIDANAVGTPTLKLFICYSREDLDLVDRLAVALRNRSIEPIYDRTNIEKLAVWSERIGQLIAASDTLLFVLSPASVTSEACAVELTLAIKANKRLAPLVARDVPDDRVPPPLARLNFVFCRDGDNFDAAVDELVFALATDVDWIRDHTRLAEAARRWEERGHRDDLLLRGAELVAAFDWAARRPPRAPEPTERHRHFIETSIRQIERAARAYDDKIKALLLRAEFVQAKEELEEAAGAMTPFIGTSLADRFPAFEQRRERLTKVVVFYQAANDVYVRSGEEDFAAAKRANAIALETIGALKHEVWWDHLPAVDLTPQEADRLKYEVHRQLLLSSGLYMEPAIEKRGSRGKWDWLLKLVPFLPTFVIRFAAGYFLTKRNAPDKVAVHRDALARLARLRAFEETQDPATFPPSRTGTMLRTISELLVDFYSGPDGAPLDLSAILNRGVADLVSPTELKLNPADYYFLGLFNFFVAKRRGTPLAKLLMVGERLFPEIDMRTPYDTAERLLRTGVSREPENFWPHFVLGRALQSRHDYRGAELAFNVCISLRPTYARGYEQRALALAGQWHAKRFTDIGARAREDSARALELAGDDPSTFLPRGELLEALGDFKGALAAFVRWMEMEENAAGLMSRSTGVQDSFDFASKLLKRQASTDAPLRAECLAVQAIAHRLLKRDDDALACADDALAIVPQHAAARTVRGMILRKRGEPARALADFEVACAADPTAWLAVLQRAETRTELAHGDLGAGDWMTLAASHQGAMQPPAWMRERAIAALEHRRATAA